MHQIIKILHQTQKTLHQTFFFLPQIRKCLLQISIFYTKLVTLLGFRTNVLKKFIISNSKQRIDRKQQKHIKLIFQKNRQKMKNYINLHQIKSWPYLKYDLESIITSYVKHDFQTSLIKQGSLQCSIFWR